MAQVNDLDPIFLSYRHSDGDDLAMELVWVLRSYGVPVWHDQTHLPPGQFQRRLDEALNSGLSGAVLLVTPDIVHSEIVREQELPALLELEADPAFTFAIGNVITDATGTLDYGAPDHLLPQPTGRSESSISSLWPITPEWPSWRARWPSGGCGAPPRTVSCGWTSRHAFPPSARRRRRWRCAPARRCRVPASPCPGLGGHRPVPR